MPLRCDETDVVAGKSGARAHVEAGGILLLWSAIDPFLPIDEAPLTTNDRAAVRRLHFERDRRALASSRLLMRLGFELLGVAADAEPTRSSLGRPLLAGAPFQLSPSRTSALVACAYKCTGPLGLDVEMRCRLGPLDGLVHDMMDDSERIALDAIDGERRVDAVLKTWTRKEAVLKAIGCGLSVPPVSFAVDLVSGRVTGLRDESGRADETWRFDERWLTPDVHCSVAFADDADTTVLVHSLPQAALRSRGPRIRT